MRLRRLEPVLRQALRGPCALPAGSRLLVAVSGGADSSALLVALASVAPELGLELAAAHLHHGLRGADADGDRDHVRALCAKLGVPLVDARCDARARMRAAGLSGEAGLRTLRRRFLLSAARRTGADAIATAHTADDQLETVLMRLARGTGLAGLGGMRPRHGRWLKPLLGATRLEIERDLGAAGLAWREDASNAAPDRFRNRIRHDVVPALAHALAPGAPPEARAGLSRRAALAAADVRAGAALVARSARRRLAPAGGHAAPVGAGIGSRAGGADATGADVARLAGAPPVVRDAALRLLWRRAHTGGSGLTRRHLVLLSRLLSARDGASVPLPAGFQAVRERGRLRFQRAGGSPRRAPRDGRLAPGSLDSPRAGRGRPAAGAAAHLRRRRASRAATMESHD
ncbi:MAG TPA: tRNA lysidine(34) synthetase TilS [Candidatus Acidoferrales bacterium]|nr:tRNA lysidine(34) synthetase TilS [Candidatus Acidoferrales bacterium]